MAETHARALATPTLEPPARLLIVQAPYYAEIAEGQLAGAKALLDGARAGYDVVEVPGALEIPPAIRLAAETGKYEGYVALGCVIRGETTHYETVCEESARGITLLGIGEGGVRPLAIGNGILTCETLAQAEERADPARQDKGGGAAAAALHLIALARRFSGVPRPPAGDDGETFLYAGAAGLSRTA